MSAKLDFQEFKSPSPLYRSAPFWSWNGHMEEKRVADQLRSFYAAGMGGAFIHSRSGLKTPYMEDKWFSCVHAAVDTAVASGKKVYLYDEDRYSSGFAGGDICRQNPEFRLRHLTVATEPDPEGETIAVFAVSRSNPQRITAYRRVEPCERLSEGEQLLWFQVCDFVRNPLWHNDSAPVDLCNAEAVDAFIAHTYERYAQECGEYFGDTIPAIFTDEVCMSVLPSGKRSESVIANHHWTHNYDRLFIERFGYDFRDYLPELFFAVESPKKPTLSADYLRGIADLFETNFSAKLASWCDTHGLAFTGHMNFAGFTDFARVGNPFRHYACWQWPGMDILTDQIAKLSAFKMTASAAHQYGAGRMVCETYGCTGWDWPLHRHRFHAGWQFCLGVNFRCQHLSHYTIAGWGKKDYPASISTHSPWFSDYNLIEDYCARISYALTRGIYAARTLVLSPYETVIGLYRGNHFGNTDPALEQISNLNTTWEKINRTLIEHHVDFDYGDESLMLEKGKFTDGKVTVGNMTYDTVLVLPGHSPCPALMEHLDEAGVRCVHLLDEMVPYSLLRELNHGYSVVTEESNAADIWSTRRIDDDKTILFLQSMAKQEREVTVTIPHAGNVLALDEITGDLLTVPSVTCGGYTQCCVTLKPEANILLLCGYAQEGRISPHSMPTRKLQLPNGPYRYVMNEPNTLPLDEVQIAFEDSDWSQPMPLSEAEERIRARYGLPPQKFYESAQPWYIHRHSYISTNEKCRMRFRFAVSELPDICCLALEGYHTFDCVSVNGYTLPAPDGYLIDPDLQTIDIANQLRTGENEILVTFRYNTDIELENVILAGNFAVYPISAERPMAAGNLQLCHLPQTITAGSWTENGLPFYTGRLTYICQFDSDGEPCVLDLTGIKALACTVELNTYKLTKVCPPFVFDLSDSVQKGSNELRIQLCAGRKNLFGPLHVERPTIVEPDDFRFDSPYWTGEYQLHDFGLMH